MFQFDTSAYMSIEDVLANFRSIWKPEQKTELIAVEKALGRIAARDLHAAHSIPVYRSARADAIAVRSADFANGMPDTSAWVLGEDYVMADMGDDFDDRFDALIMVEDVEIANGKISFPAPLKVVAGQLISQRGAMVAEGDMILTKGRRISAFDQANLVMAGIEKIEVIMKPKIVFIPTGDELIPAGTKPERGQIIDSNTIMVRNFLEEWGAEVFCYPIVKDITKDLEKALKKAKAEADIVLINGGSSKGQEDLCTKLLQQNADFFQHYVKAVPGRPVAVSISNNQPLVNIPGPVPAAFCVLHWCVKALIEQYYLYVQLGNKRFVARMKNAMEFEGKVAIGMWFHVEKEGNEYYATAYTKEEKLANLIKYADAFAMIPLGCTGFNVGDELELTWIEALA